ncbi:MAG: ZIP family metal transporter [Patescibacteria group bacterium]|nr:ZIP family metal transporter [Patescibacteria group bacterium]
MNTWTLTLLSVVLVSVVSLIGILALVLNKRILQKILIFLVSFAVGAIFGDAFLHIMPEIYHHVERAGHDHGATLIPSLFVLAGILIFFSIEKFLRWRHCHHIPSEDHPHPVATMNLIGDGVHNFLDGVLIASSYLVSPQIGIATTIAVLLHEIPQEIGDFATLLHAGYSRKKALFYNFVFATTAILGAVLVLGVGTSVTTAEKFLLPLTAGGFIYIAGSDLIPMLHKKNTPWTSLLQILSIILGIGVMVLVMLFE